MTQQKSARRSCLYMPGSNERALEKAKGLAADTLIFDLEDAVRPDAKETARQLVCDAVRSRAYGSREVIVRVNGLDTPWGEDDLAAAIAAKPDGVLLPKVETAATLKRVAELISRHGDNSEMPIWAMIETPKGILNVADIAKQAEHMTLSAFVVGTNDLAKEMRVTAQPDRSNFLFALSSIATAALAYGITPVDGVYNSITDTDGLAAECEQGIQLGFKGKTLIHPSQLETANTLFAPSEEEVAEAQAIVDAFELPENAGRGVITVDGKMVEILHLESARELLARAQAISSVTSEPSE